MKSVTSVLPKFIRSRMAGSTRADFSLIGIASLERIFKAPEKLPYFLCSLALSTFRRDPGKCSPSGSTNLRKSLTLRGKRFLSKRNEFQLMGLY